MRAVVQEIGLGNCDVFVPYFCQSPPKVIYAMTRRWFYNPHSAFCFERWALWRKIGAL